MYFMRGRRNVSEARRYGARKRHMTENNGNDNVVALPLGLDALTRLTSRMVRKGSELGVGFFLACQLSSLFLAAGLWWMWSLDFVLHKVSLSLFLGPFIFLMPLYAIEASSGTLTLLLRILQSLLVLAAILGLCAMFAIAVSLTIFGERIALP